jgi:hypothetical protein
MATMCCFPKPNFVFAGKATNFASFPWAQETIQLKAGTDDPLMYLSHGSQMEAEGHTEPCLSVTTRNRLAQMRTHLSALIPNQSVLSLNGTHLGLAELHVSHSKDETGLCEWAMMDLRSLINLFILNNMAERVGFEFSLQRSFNNMENTAGTVKAMEDSGKQC